jgi:hypothetical protein
MARTQHDNPIGRGPRARGLRVRAPRTLRPRLNIAIPTALSRPFQSFADNRDRPEISAGSASTYHLGLRTHVVQGLSLGMQEREQRIDDGDQAQ